MEEIDRKTKTKTKKSLLKEMDLKTEYSDYFIINFISLDTIRSQI